MLGKLGCIIALVIASQSAQAANIYVAPMRITGIPAIWITGKILPDDDKKFDAIAEKRKASVVYLSSPGGNLVAAINIGLSVRILGLDTFVGRGGDGCWSACPLIWLAGRHAIVQRNSYLGFHASSGPLGTEVMAKYLAYIGLTSAQIDYMVRTPNSDIQIATEADALALGFHPQVVLFWLWQSCRAKYCLAVP